MKRDVVIKRGWLLMAAVVFAVLLAGGVVVRELDVSRLEAENVRAAERQGQANARVIDNLRRTTRDLRRTTRVLCARGNTLINLTNGALVLVGQRLQADVRAGNAAAVRADRRFLTEFLKDREKLIREQTGDGPCAP